MGEHELISVWRAWARAQIGGQGRLFLPGDAAVIENLQNVDRLSDAQDWHSFSHRLDFGRGGDTRFHLHLVPVPFVGDLENAKVVLLLMNPGLAPTDYYGEFQVAGFRERLFGNLSQAPAERDYPFFYLDPDIAWHSGFGWWQRKLGSVIAKLATRWGVDFATARQRVSREIAAIELVPYHSESFNLRPQWRDALSSTQLARSYVHSVLLPRAAAGDVKLLVMRQAVAWGVNAGPNITVYNGVQARAAHLSLDTGGGEIVDMLAADA